MSQNNWFSTKHHSYKQPRDEKGRFVKKPTLLERIIQSVFSGLGSALVTIASWIKICFLIYVYLMVIALAVFLCLFCLYVMLVIISIPIMIVVMAISSAVEFIVNNVLGFHEFHISWLHQLLDS